MTTVRGAAASVLGLVLALAGCSWIGEQEAPPLPGKRVAVLAPERSPEPDAGVTGVPIILPPANPMPDWPQVGGSATHAPRHVVAAGPLEEIWETDIGAGGGMRSLIAAAPVIADGRIFVIDADSTVSALDAGSGDDLWDVEVLPEDESGDGFSGAAAYADGRLYVSTSAGEIVVLSAADGTEIWRVSVRRPIRSAPTISDGRLYVQTHDNEIFALDARDGRELWSFAGIAEVAQLTGSPSPAVADGIVVVAFSSGEIFGLNAESGRVAWTDSLGFTRRTGGLSALTDISGSPVIDQGRVFAVSHAGQLVAIALKTGDRLWDQEIVGVQTPWVAGDFVYIISTRGDLICVSRLDGRIRWVHSLPRYLDPEDSEDPIMWSGPVLVSERLIVVGSHGEARLVSPYTGEFIATLDIPDEVEQPPVVAGGTVFILGGDADLMALR